MAAGEIEPALDGEATTFADFTEALGFIKSSIAKMDRLISAILNSPEGARLRAVRMETAN